MQKFYFVFIEYARKCKEEKKALDSFLNEFNTNGNTHFCLFADRKNIQNCLVCYICRG